MTADRQPKPRGRKPLPPEQRLDETTILRMTAAQKAKLARLGGAEWVREQIERARER